MILVFKLFAAPILIAALTWATRRFGPGLAGLLLGIPLTTGPISAIVAWEQGPAFAAQAATANLAGQVSTCLFCLAYWLGGRRKLNCWASATLGLATFAASTALWSQFAWTFPRALAVLLTAILLLLRIMRSDRPATPMPRPPAWDLPARMLLAAAFVVGLTTVSGHLGPTLVGLLAPFPTFVLIFSIFTHWQAGYGHTANLLRGVVLGSFSSASFFTVVALGLPEFNPMLVYTGAAACSVLASAMLRFRKP